MKYIMAEIRFDAYDPQKDKDVQNGTRRALLGLRPPKIPKIVNESIGYPALQYVFFSLIKEPIKEVMLGGKRRRLRGYNLARGAVVLYAYTWKDDKLQNIINRLKEVLLDVKERCRWLKWANFRLYVVEEV